MYFKERVKYFQKYLICVFLRLTFNADVATATSTAPSLCSTLQWQCENGPCIQIDELCDGVAHCADSSDESAEHCIHRFCPPYAFRCAYGACITGTSKCNGLQDCRDNSDETSFLCSRNVAELEQQLIGNCSRRMSAAAEMNERETLLMQCKSGECIRMEQRCDGLKDCFDGSDETVALCSYLYCPNYAFRCGYGGCIRGTAKCDGFADCIDGSDEAAELCGYKRRPVGEMKPSEVLKPTKRPQSGCLIPFNRRSLQARHLYGDATRLPLGSRVSVGSEIVFLCERGWTLQGHGHNLCLDNNNWKYPVPSCIKSCSHTTLSKGISTIATCFYEDRPLNCTDHLRVGTTAHVRCAPGYDLPEKKPKVTTMTCDVDGEWDYPKFKCKPQCGLIGQEATTTTLVPIIKRPWHVSLYSRLFDGTQRRVCGGAIITPNLIITAAICFMDKANDLQDETIFHNVMLGHHLPELQAGEYRLKNLYNISQILMPDYDYRLSNYDYQHKIALLVLVNPLNLAQVAAKPICLEHLNQFEAHSEMFHKLTLSCQQQTDLGYIDSGYSLDEITGRRHALAGIVEDFNEDTGAITIINVNYYKMFLRRIIRRYKYIF